MRKRVNIKIPSGVCKMKLRNLVVTLILSALTATLFLGIAAEAQAPKPGANKPAGTLAQVMRGILFPNSNVIFYAQANDPATVKPAADPSTAVNPLEGQFGGWAAVENSSIALSESVTLITMPGRLCSNGKPVPLTDPDWSKFSQALRTAAASAYTAAKAKNKDKMSDAADAVGAACGDCHNKYRDLAGGVKDHCLSSK
jgi:hypothetical protein